MNGTERIGWLQAAFSLSEAAGYEYVVYVDGQRTSLGTTSCEAATGAGYPCSAALPALAPGRRVLELAAIKAGEDGPQEGPRSEPLVIYVDPSARSTWSVMVPADDVPVESSPRAEFACSDGAACVDVRVWTLALARPHALVPLSQGRALVVDRDSRIWEVSQEGQLRGLEVSPGCPGPSEVTSITADPGFAANRLVYAAWRCMAFEGARRLFVIRYRELNGVLAEAVTILDWPTTPRAVPVITMGGDGKLYAAVPEPESWAVLRVSVDGSTPRDNPAGSPIVQRLRQVTALSRSPAGALVIGDRGDIISYEETSGAEQGSGVTLSVRRLALDRQSAAFATLAVSPAPADAWRVIAAEAGTGFMHRLRKDRDALKPSGALAVSSCGVPTELAWEPDGTIWSLGFLERKGAGASPTEPAWRICLMRDAPGPAADAIGRERVK